MINLLATGLISLCLISPAQSPGCVGDISVPTPLPSVSIPATPLPQLPIAPVLPTIPALILPVPAPAPVLPPVVPVAPPSAPVVPAPIRVPVAPPAVHVPPPVAREQPLPPVPQDAPPAVEETQPQTPPEPAPTTTPEPTPSPTVGSPVTVVDTAPDKPEPSIFRFPPFADGSAGAIVGGTVAQWPDFTLLLTALAALGIIVLNEKLDTTPEPRRVPKRSKVKKADLG